MTTADRPGLDGYAHDTKPPQCLNCGAVPQRGDPRHFADCVSVTGKGRTYVEWEEYYNQHQDGEFEEGE